MQPALVRLDSTTSQGSGWVIEVSGDAAYVVTNRHVVEEANGWVLAIVGDGAMFLGEVVGLDGEYDLAAVRICCSDKFHPLELASPQLHSFGVEIGAFGYPLGATTLKATWGEVGTVLDSPTQRGTDMLTRLDTFPGNSGGPLVSRSGRVLGIIVGGVPNEPVAIAVSAQAIRQRWPLLIEGHTPSTPGIKWTRNPSVSERGTLDVDVQIERHSFTPCGSLTLIGQSCHPNVRVYRNGDYYEAVFGYYCGPGNPDWCIDQGGEHHHYYPASRRLFVKAHTDLHNWPAGDLWHVCIHDNTDEETLLGCAELEFKR